MSISSYAICNLLRIRTPISVVSTTEKEDPPWNYSDIYAFFPFAHMVNELTLYEEYLLWKYLSSLVYTPRATFIAQEENPFSICAPSIVANVLTMYFTDRRHPDTPTAYSGCTSLI